MSRPAAGARGALLAVAAGLVVAAAGCSDATPSTSGEAASTAVAPTRGAPVPVVSLPTALPPAALSEARVRGQDYAYSVPRDWTEVDLDADPQPDSTIAPRDEALPYYIAVDRVFGVGARSLDEVVAQLEDGFSGEGTLGALPRRQVAGFTAAGVVVDVPPRTRHVYAISIYAERAFPIRVTYDPDHEEEALAAFAAVLDSWTWG